RRQQPVLDLPRPAKVRHHREGNSLYAGEGETYRQNTRQQRRAITATHKSHLGQQVTKYDDEEQRLKRSAYEKVAQLASGHSKIPQQQRAEDARRGHTASSGRIQASFLPVSEMKSVSKLGGER